MLDRIPCKSTLNSLLHFLQETLQSRFKNEKVSKGKDGNDIHVGPSLLWDQSIACQLPSVDKVPKEDMKVLDPRLNHFLHLLGLHPTQNPDVFPSDAGVPRWRYNIEITFPFIFHMRSMEKLIHGTNRMLEMISITVAALGISSGEPNIRDSRQQL